MKLKFICVKSETSDPTEKGKGRPPLEYNVGTYPWFRHLPRLYAPNQT